MPYDSDRWPLYFAQAADVYLYIEEKAVKTEEGLVFTGTMESVRTHLKISRGSWGPIKALLQDTIPTIDEDGHSLPVVGTVLVRLRRGGNTSPSEWLVNRPLSELDLAVYRNSSEGLTTAARHAKVVSDYERRIEQLESRIRELEARLEG